MAELCIKDANSCCNVLNEINVKALKIDDKPVELKCIKSSELTSKQFDVLLHLTEENMKELYEQSKWGWNREQKLKEFRHKTAQFLLLRFKDKLIGFCHFRFEHGSDYSEASVYCYELQVLKECRRNGVGQYLMNILVLLANRFQICKVMLTVFKHNPIAMDFYMRTMKYKIDKSSPSRFNEETDYEILSLKITNRK